MSNQNTTKRRKKGTGSIRYMKDQKIWEARFTYGKLPNGKPDRRSKYAKTYETALYMLEAMKQEVEFIKNSKNPHAPFSEYARIWLHDRDVKASTHTSDTLIINNMILPYIGELPICNIKERDLKKIFAESKKKGYPIKTIKKTHDILYRLFWQAMVDKVILRSPMLDIPLQTLDLE